MLVRDEVIAPLCISCRRSQAEHEAHRLLGDGRPVLLSEHVFPAHRTELVVDLPSTDQSIAPSGLRLLG